MEKYLNDIPLEELQMIASHIGNVFCLPIETNLMEVKEFRIFMEQLTNCIKNKKDKI